MVSESLLETVLLSDRTPTSIDLKRLVSTYAEPGSRTEVVALEFKEGFDRSGRAWLVLLKELVAMSNSGGGLVVFGIRNDGSRVGCDASLVDDLDPTRVSDRLRRYCPNARLTTATYGVISYRKSLVFVRAFGSGNITTFDHDGNYEERGEQRAAFHRGVVYMRRAGGVAEATQVEIDRVVEGMIARGVRQFLAKVSPIATTIATLPADAAVEVVGRTPEGGAVITLGEGGLPAYLADRSTPGALPIVEVTDPMLPYADLAAEIATQLRAWRQGSAPHLVSRQEVEGWYGRRRELTIGDDIAEFCFDSAISDFGLPMFWAAAMSRRRLDGVIDRHLSTLSYPACQAIPFVIAGFRWDRKRELLLRIGADSPGITARIARRLSRLSNRPAFVRRCRFPGRTFRLAGNRYVMSDVLDDPTQALRVFDALVEAGQSARLPTPLKQVAHQLDLALHAE